MSEYKNRLVWKQGLESVLKAEGKHDISVSTPPEFGGPYGPWSPEDFFVASVGSCLVSTFLFFCKSKGVVLKGAFCETSGLFEKTKDGLRFTKILAEMSVRVDSETDVDQVRSLNSKLEKYCPISNSIVCPVEVLLDVSVDNKE